MKIGVLTYHCVPNFGAQLQAISTIGYLQKNGHEAVLLNWYAKDLEEMYSRRIPTDQIKCHKKFTEEALPISSKLQTIDALVSEIERLKLDAIIVGSDALFKYIPLNKRRHFEKRKLRYKIDFVPLSCELLDDNPFFGSFIEHLSTKVPASVYAVSSQNCPFEVLSWKERRQIANALSNYKTISVRDAWTKKMVEAITNRKNIQIYPDPVFSFNTNSYIPIPTKENILQRFGLEENYILLSFSNWHIKSETISSIAQEVERRGYKPVALPMPERLNAPCIEKQINLPLSPIDWYGLIIHSKGYIGERMHPIVVCLHNAIPFYCFDEYGTFVKTSIFTRTTKYNPLSSKTFQIVAEAKLTDYLYSYKGGEAMPSPQQILNKLLAFDSFGCKAFAETMKSRYNLGMNEIIKSLY